MHTPGYGLWGLDVAGHKPNKLTEAMVGYLLNYQQDLGHWQVGLDQRPAEASHFTTNYLAILAVKRFGVAHQKDRIATRTKAVEKWLASAEIRNTEDEVSRLRLARESEFDRRDLELLVDELAGKQRDDGGWSQTEAMTSDAYATGSVLVALHEAGKLPIDHASWQRGPQYLLHTQKSDGSWHVVTRAKPMPVYFESGVPNRVVCCVSSISKALK